MGSQSWWSGQNILFRIFTSLLLDSSFVLWLGMVQGNDLVTQIKTHVHQMGENRPMKSIPLDQTSPLLGHLVSLGESVSHLLEKLICILEEVHFGLPFLQFSLRPSDLHILSLQFSQVHRRKGRFESICIFARLP